MILLFKEKIECDTSNMKIKISGEWTHNVVFDNEDQYWDINDYESFTMYKIDYVLSINGRNRLYLEALFKGNEEESQEGRSATKESQEIKG